MLSWKRNDVTEVTDCCVHAVRSSEPCLRYGAPHGLSVLNDVMTVLWTHVTDWVLSRVYRVEALPDMLRPIHNGRMGRRRSHAS